MTRHPANRKQYEQWVTLCELAAQEQDDEKLGDLFEEMLRFLDDKQHRLTAPLPMAERTPQQTQP